MYKLVSLAQFKRNAHVIHLLTFLAISSGYISSAQQTGIGVVLHADPRLSILVKKEHSFGPIRDADGSSSHLVASGEITKVPAVPTPETAAAFKMPAVVYSGKGYRVQIYSGADREKAMKIKTEFMRRYPSIHSYISYSAPSFRIKVGDYRTRNDAEAMQRELNDSYSPTMVVPDEVTVMSH